MVRDFTPLGANTSEISHPDHGRDWALPRKAFSIQWLKRIARTGDSGMDFALPPSNESGHLEARSRRHPQLTIRVTNENGETVTTLRIEGQLTSTHVPDLRAACESAHLPLRLDLTGLRSADTDGIQALRSLSEAGAELYGASPFINQLLLEANR
jgi:hypothetical protein